MNTEQQQSHLTSACVGDASKTALPLMRAGFCTSVSYGPDRRYDVVFSFRSIDAMQAAHREWIEFAQAGAACEASAGAVPSNEKVADSYAVLLAALQEIAREDAGGFYAAIANKALAKAGVTP